VRESALQCMAHFLDGLKENHRVAEDAARRAAMAAGPAGTEAATAGSAAGGGLLTSFGWAVSSLLPRGAAGADVPVAAPTLGPAPRQPAAPSTEPVPARKAPSFSSSSTVPSWSGPGPMEQPSGAAPAAAATTEVCPHPWRSASRCYREVVLGNPVKGPFIG
jgi:hypothetical protein